MGKSVTAIIAYGVFVEEAPWQDEEWNDDYGEWWFKGVHKFKPSKEVWDEKGARLPGMTDKDASDFFEEERKFKKANPFPYDLEMLRSGDSYQWFLCLPMEDFGIGADWGDATAFEPSDLKIPKDTAKKMKAFCKKYKITYSDEPSWTLIAYSDY